jgi:hypothetical protein
VSTDIESTAEEEEKDEKYSSGVSTAKYTGAWFSQPSHAKPLEKGTTERFKEAQKLEEEVGVKKASVLRREKRKEQEQEEVEEDMKRTFEKMQGGGRSAKTTKLEKR